MRRIFLDIETLPPGEDTRARVAVEVKRELAEATEQPSDAAFAEVVEARFRELALVAEKGRLLCVGVIIEQDNQILHHGLLGRDRATNRFHLDEARTLTSFWKLMRDFNPRRDLLIGHNLLDFDLPFLCKRSIINRVQPSIDICFRRFQQQPIFDTMWEWNHWRKGIKLHELAEALEITSPKQDGVNGSCIYDHFRADRHDEIAQYCMRDVECVRAIYYRMNFLEAPPLVTYHLKATLPAGKRAHAAGGS